MSVTPDTDETDFRLPRDVVPTRYELTLAPDLGRRGVPRPRARRARGDGADDARSSATPAELEISNATLELAGRAPTSPSRSRSPSNEDLERVSFTPPGPLLPGPCVLECDFAGRAERQAPRLLPEHLSRRGGQRARHRRHPVRVDRRPEGLPLLGRARPQGRLLGHPRGAPGPAGDLERRRALRDASSAAASAGSSSPTRSRCRPTSSPSSSARSRQRDAVDVDGIALRVVHIAGKDHLTGFALEAARTRLRFFTEYFDQPYPGDKLDLVAIPDFAFGRDGEPRLHHLPRGRAARPIPTARRAPSSRARVGRRARDRPHVVRRPRDDELVERHLAERGLRHLHGAVLPRRLQARVPVLGRLRPRPGDGASHSTGCTRRGRSSSRCEPPARSSRCSTSSPTKRAPACCGCSSSTSGTTASATACAATSPPTATPTPRRPTCGTRSRQAAEGEPIRALMDSWIRQGGHPLVTARAQGHEVVLTQAPFSYLPEQDRPDRLRTERHRLELARPGRPRAAPRRRPPGGRPAHVTSCCAHEPMRDPGRQRHARGQRRRQRGLPPALRRRAARRHPRRLRPPRAAGALQARRRHLGVRAGRPGAARAVPRPRPPPRGREGPERVVDGRRCARPAGLRRRRRRPRRSSRPSCSRCSAPSSSASAGTRARRRRRGRPAARGPHRRPRHRRRRPGGAGREPATVSPPSRTARALDADIASAVLRVVATDCRARRVRPLLAPFPLSRQPPGGAALPRLAQLCARPRARCETCELCLGEIRTQDAPYLLRKLLINRVVGPQVWDFVTAHCDSPARVVPGELDPEDARGLPPLPARPGRHAWLSRRGHRLLASHRLGGQQRAVDQSLERLAVNVRFVLAQRPHLRPLLLKA